MRVSSLPLSLVVLIAAAIRCDSGGEAPRVRLEVVVDASRVTPCTTDLGYTVELTALEVGVGPIGFTVHGETHAWLAPMQRALAPAARAHPGHYAGGEVTGELTGARAIDWIGDDGASLGTATLLPGDYHGANLALFVDPTLGHGAHVAGTARRDGRTVTFDATLDLPDPPLVVGAPLELVVDEGTRARLGVAFTTIDPFEADTVFDGLDFFALADARATPGAALVIAPEDAAHNVLRRRLFTHDHFMIIATELE